MARWMSPRKQHAPQSRGGRGVHGAALAAALWLHAGAGVAAQDCAGQAGATLLRQQVLPDTPVRYLACKLPAASRDGRQIVIADDGDTVGPSSCQNQVCTFKAADGRAVKRWDLQAAPPGDTLDARMAALAEALRADGFTPMTSLQPGMPPRGTVLTGAGTRVEFHHSSRRAWLQIRVEGRTHPLPLCVTPHALPDRTPATDAAVGGSRLGAGRGCRTCRGSAVSRQRSRLLMDRVGRGASRGSVETLSGSAAGQTGATTARPRLARPG
jgi:hypothetical protein